MLEKILQKMQTQRGTTSNVSDKTLTDLATTILPTITTEEQLAAVDFSLIIKSLDGNISFHTAGAVKKVTEEKDATITALEKKVKPVKTETNPGDEEQPQWAKDIIAQNEALQTELNTIKSKETGSTRSTKVAEVLKDLPEYYTAPIKKAFTRMQFATDEEFNAYVTELTGDRDQFIQTAKEHKMPNFNPAPTPKPEEETGQTPVLQNARALVQKAKEAAAATPNK